MVISLAEKRGEKKAHLDVIFKTIRKINEGELRWFQIHLVHRILAIKNESINKNDLKK